MRTVMTLVAVMSGAVFGQIAEIDDFWIDSVRRGPMEREVRALGAIMTPTIVESRMPETLLAEARLGQSVEVNPMSEIMGRVVRIQKGASSTTGKVIVRLNRATSVAPGTGIEAAIELERLEDVVYVGRPYLLIRTVKEWSLDWRRMACTRPESA